MVLLLTLMGMTAAAAAEDWMQFKYDCRHSGNVPDRALTTPLGLIGAVPLTDAVFTAPVVADGRVYVVDGTLYYSCFFGYAAKTRIRHFAGPSAKGLTAAIEPMTGRVIWLTTKYYVTAGTTISAENGRLYLGGYNRPNEKTNNRYVWCLDAENGSLIWQSEPVAKAVNVVTIGRKFLFFHASTGKPSYLIDKRTGKILSVFDKGHACTRFTLSEPYIIGPNMDMIDASNANMLVSSGPCVDVRECVGAVVSNGRVFYTSQGSGLQLCQVYGAEADSLAAPWPKASR